MEKIVQVPANGACRNKLGRQFEVAQLRVRRREQAELQFAREREITLQAALLACDFLVQSSILQSDSYLRRQRGHRTLVIFREKAAAGVFQIEHANHVVLVN